MWRLIKNTAKGTLPSHYGTFDIAFVAENGELIVRSDQGYENKQDAVVAIFSMGAMEFQDETNTKTVFYVRSMHSDKFVSVNLKAVKRYKP